MGRSIEILRPIEPLPVEAWQGAEHALAIKPEDWPPHYVVFLILVYGADCPYLERRAEKVAWSIYLAYEGRRFCLELRKSGLSATSLDEETTPDHVRKLGRLVKRAVPAIDELVRPFAREQLRAGEFSLDSRLFLFDEKYSFFRTLALRLLRAQGIPLPPPNADALKHAESHWNRLLGRERRGYYLASAAIEAFFGRLEHLLVLILPFVNPEGRVDPYDFLRASWEYKFRRVYDLASDGRANEIFAALKSVREAYRNPEAHGGYVKDGSSITIYVPGAGGIPATLRTHLRRSELSVTPVDERAFREIARTFDACDDYLEIGPTRYGVRYARAGFPVGFSAGLRAVYREAIRSEDKFALLLDRLAHEQAEYMNMDW